MQTLLGAQQIHQLAYLRRSIDATQAGFRSDRVVLMDTFVLPLRTLLVRNNMAVSYVLYLEGYRRASTRILLTFEGKQLLDLKAKGYSMKF